MRLFKSKDPLLKAVEKVADPDWSMSGDKFFWKRCYRDKGLPVLMQFEKDEDEKSYYYHGSYAVLLDTSRSSSLYVLLERVDDLLAENLANDGLSARDYFFEFDILGELPGTINNIQVKNGSIDNKCKIGDTFVAEYSPIGYGRLELKIPSQSIVSSVLEEYNKKIK